MIGKVVHLESNGVKNMPILNKKRKKEISCIATTQLAPLYSLETFS